MNCIFILSFKNEAEADEFLSINADNINIFHAEKSNIYEADTLGTNGSLFAEHGLEKIKAWSISGELPQLTKVIIDTVVDFLHHDLLNQIAVNDAEYINHNGRLDPTYFYNIDDGGNGFVDKPTETDKFSLVNLYENQSGNFSNYS